MTDNPGLRHDARHGPVGRSWRVTPGTVVQADVL